jgi:hypothetical protein
LNNRCLYWASEAGDRSDGSVSVAEINRRVLALENGTRLPMPQEPSPGLVGIDAVDDLVEDAFVLQNSFAELLSVPPPPTESTAADDRAQLSSYLDDFHASLWQLCPEGFDADQANQGDSLQIGGDTGYSVDCTSGLCSYTLVPAR